MIEQLGFSKRILVDQDGVIADFERAFLSVWRQKYPNRPFVPIQERKNFSIRKDYPPEYSTDIYNILTSKGFIENLPPIEGVLQAFREMREDGLILKICTSPLSNYENCVTEKFAWVEKHFGLEWTENIIIIKDKTQVRGDLLIDDKPDVIGDLSPTWEHVIFDQPYNRHITNKRRLTTWTNWSKILKP